MNMPHIIPNLAVIAFLSGIAACLPTFATSPAPVERPAAPAAKRPITSFEQLPRREYQLSRLPSDLIEAPRSELAAVVDAVDKDLERDLATLDIRDAATRNGMILSRAQFALHRGDHEAAAALLRETRVGQGKGADKLTGTSLEHILAARMRGGSLEAQRVLVRESLAAAYGAMPWTVVGESFRDAKTGLELMSRDVMLESLRTNMDPAAKSLGLRVPGGFVTAIVAMRNNIEHVLPFRDQIVAVLAEIVDRNRVAKVDRWSERLVSLPATAAGKPVVIGVWDTGVDHALFAATNPPGIAFDKDWNPASALLRPMGESQTPLPALRQHVKGAMDMRAAIDSPQARQLRQHAASLSAADVKRFTEDIVAIGMWAHGTHVAGIAVDGNPFARIATVAVHFGHNAVAPLPDEARAARAAAAYRKAVETFSKSGARVVNIGWRHSAANYEATLAHHNVGKTPDERKAIAAKIFDLERKALEAALRSAPDILFVAASAGQKDGAGSNHDIPASLELPNLITVGAVDITGTETEFATFGKTVAVHANGYEVESYLPGGDRVRFSGASLAAPQVSNLAAKLFAMKPELGMAEVKQLIIEGAERNGRVNVIHPKKTLALADVKLEH